MFSSPLCQCPKDSLIMRLIAASLQLLAYSCQLIAASLQLLTYSYQLIATSFQLLTYILQLLAYSYQLLAYSYQLLATNLQLIATCLQLLATSLQLLATSFQLLASSFQHLASSIQLLASSFQLLASSFQLLASSFELLAASCQLIAVTLYLPTQRYQLKVTSSKLIAYRFFLQLIAKRIANFFNSFILTDYAISFIQEIIKSRNIFKLYFYNFCAVYLLFRCPKYYDYVTSLCCPTPSANRPNFVSALLCSIYFDTRWQYLSQLKGSIFSLPKKNLLWETQQLILGIHNTIWWVEEPFYIIIVL